MSSPYRGRFAPSPTGPLHFGSLVCALAGYLDAKHHHGQWLLRIEDLDPPRTQAGASSAIIAALQAHGLQWDEDIVWQSQRNNAYQQTLQHLTQIGDTYPCICTRRDISAMGHVYNGHCKQHPPTQLVHSATRLRLKPAQTNCERTYLDVFQGPQQQSLLTEVGDFIVHRKDGLFAYQLAVVVDDIAQRITHTIRGYDLIDSAPRQHYLMERLGYTPPTMGHIPVAAFQHGQKLSKQNHAPALDNKLALDNLYQALQFLGQQPPSQLAHTNIAELLGWAVTHWQRSRVPSVTSIVVSAHE